MLGKQNRGADTRRYVSIISYELFFTQVRSNISIFVKMKDTIRGPALYLDQVQSSALLRILKDCRKSMVDGRYAILSRDIHF